MTDAREHQINATQFNEKVDMVTRLSLNISSAHALFQKVSENRALVGPGEAAKLLASVRNQTKINLAYEDFLYYPNRTLAQVGTALQLPLRNQQAPSKKDKFFKRSSDSLRENVDDDSWPNLLQAFCGSKFEWILYDFKCRKDNTRDTEIRAD